MRKRLILFAVFAVVAAWLSIATPTVKCEDCPPGQVFEPDGGQYCTWLLINGTWEFVCGPTGECISACYPYECADRPAAGKRKR